MGGWVGGVMCVCVWGGVTKEHLVYPNTKARHVRAGTSAAPAASVDSLQHQPKQTSCQLQ